MKSRLNEELHQTNKISSNFQSDITRIKSKLLETAFPKNLIVNTINDLFNVGIGVYRTKMAFRRMEKSFS